MVKLNSITRRQLHELDNSSLLHNLPTKVTYDGDVVAIVLSVEQYAKLVNAYKDYTSLLHKLDEQVGEDRTVYDVTQARKYDAIKW